MPEESAPEAAPAPAAVPIPESMAETVEVEPVITETMAEVYLKQGLVHEAREVYRKLVEQRPADTALRSRLAALEQRVSSAPSPAAQRPRYAAVETGGQAARSLFSQVLSARVAARQAAAAHAGTGSTGAALDAAFANDPAPGAPTSPAGDELSLAAVFGEEASPAPAPAAPPAPAPVPGGQGFSFDEFFGGKKPEPKPAAPPPPAEAEPTPSDFVSWLKGLKS
jgi:2-oxoglutarate dehydrogenase E2 component (dihydrolipoamide succinyltransferase)